MSFWQALIGTSWLIRNFDSARGRIVKVVHIDGQRALLVGDRPSPSAAISWWVEIAELMSTVRNDNTTQYVCLGFDSDSWFGPGQWVIRIKDENEAYYTPSDGIRDMELTAPLAWQVKTWSQTMGTVYFHAIAEDPTRPLPPQHHIRRLAEYIPRFLDGMWRPATPSEIETVAAVRERMLSFSVETEVEPDEPETEETEDTPASVTQEQDQSLVWKSF